MLSVKNFNIDSNLNCSLSSSPMSPSSDTSNEENSFQHNLGFGVNESNQHISLMGDGITSFTGTITGNGTSNSGSSGVKRKREKLDHLSEEEKLMRRKLKNRISAQTARDRKKEKLSELECKVNQMSKANCLLLKENVELKKKLDLNKLNELLKHNEQLQAENKQLKERLDALESRINNDSIRVTAQPSVRNISQKSNKVKVESNSESLVTEKSKVNSIESAEEPGANQRDLSDLDQAISSLINFDGDECEEIIKWLHRCSEQLLDQNIDQLSEDSGIEDGGSHSDEASNRLSPASEEPKERDLESIRDLITFDHMYHRNDFLVQPQVDEMTVTTTSPITVETESILTDNCVKNSTSFSENSLKPSTSNPSSLCYPSLPQPNDNLVNKPLNFFNPIDSSILSSESAFYESNLNLFDDLFPELI